MKRSHSTLLIKSRSAFSLVELMVAITVIGLLAGVLFVGLAPAWKRAGEAAIQVEMTQLEGAIEAFNTKFGFYPPSFMRIRAAGDLDGDGNVYEDGGVGGTDVLDEDDCVLAMAQYLNRIAPNHFENEPVGPVPSGGPDGSRPSRLRLWWRTVGQNIHFKDGDDLVFWLSGLFKNKQFPLTAATPTVDDLGNRISEVAFMTRLASSFNDSSGGAQAREVFFDFKSNQLEIEQISNTIAVAHYLQPRGKRSVYLYLDANSYGYGPSYPQLVGDTSLDPIYFDGYTSTPGAFVTPPAFTPGAYENPNTFQLVTNGIDGIAGVPWDGAPTRATFTTDWHDYGFRTESADNQCNFIGGRLERLNLGTAESTTGL